MRSSLIFILLATAFVVAAVPFVYCRWIEPYLYRRSVKRAREELARFGLTPEQYIATIPAADIIGRARAKVRFGVDSPPTSLRRLRLAVNNSKT